MSEESPTSPSPILDMTQEKEQEAQNLQESPQPQEQQREEHTTSDDKTVSLDSSTPLTSQEEKKEEEVGIISLSSPCVTVAKLPVQDSDKDHDHDFHSQGKEKKIKTESTQDDTPRPFLERVFTDIDCEIGFLNSIIDYYANK
uniref:Uncharacterized protein n=1 Tax=Fagus sylvatica TaxID=28930 RepID=A0A2N9HF29_FAGSY